MISQTFEKLKAKNYVLKAKIKTNFWINIRKSKLNNFYINKFGDNFNLVIHTGNDFNTDFYVIPYTVIKDLFKDEYLSNSKNSKIKDRWMLFIKNNFIKHTNFKNFAIDIKDYYVNRYLLEEYDDDNNIFLIEDRKLEISVRTKQSVFRQKVLFNFNNTCCISKIKEDDLLIASHIVPWSKNKNIRLDPLNGICLSILYDKLFDKGYFTITDNLQIKTINDITSLSDTLCQILKSINGIKIMESKTLINPEYLKYHRENIFKERTIVE